MNIEAAGYDRRLAQGIADDINDTPVRADDDTIESILNILEKLNRRITHLAGEIKEPRNDY